MHEDDNCYRDSMNTKRFYKFLYCTLLSCQLLFFEFTWYHNNYFWLYIDVVFHHSIIISVSLMILSNLGFIEGEIIDQKRLRWIWDVKSNSIVTMLSTFTFLFNSTTTVKYYNVTTIFQLFTLNHCAINIIYLFIWALSISFLIPYIFLVKA